MTEQKKNIAESADYIKQQSPFKSKPDIAIVINRNSSLLKEFKIHGKIKSKDIPPYGEPSGKGDSMELLFATMKGVKKDIIIINGRYHYYNGYLLRDVVHPIYAMKELGVKTIVLIDEVGYLNPRFQIGGVSLIYDHINLMGDNPLIGVNDNSIGPRFPDMSNPYDAKLYRKIEKVFIDNKMKYYPSVYLGLTGPETETEAECRFYREIGSDVLGYSIAAENIAAVHCGLSCAAFGLISRELVADRLQEISEDEQAKNRKDAEKELGSILKDILNTI